ncbi:MAG: hypothetical protein DRO12_01335 [Thermoprotei archaeon]|nr:MAG: hypothetical protein DRO12_01335 [Thermoprotei archaeon]
MKIRLGLRLRDILGEYIVMEIRGCISYDEFLKKLGEVVGAVASVDELTIVKNGVGLAKDSLVCEDDEVVVLPSVSGG